MQKSITSCRNAEGATAAVGLFGYEIIIALAFFACLDEIAARSGRNRFSSSKGMVACSRPAMAMAPKYEGYPGSVAKIRSPGSVIAKSRCPSPSCAPIIESIFFSASRLKP